MKNYATVKLPEFAGIDEGSASYNLKKKMRKLAVQCYAPDAQGKRLPLFIRGTV